MCATPERDVAGVVAFLASDDGKYLHGSTGLIVDGGLHL